MRAQLLIASLLVFSATLAGCAGEDVGEEVTGDLDEVEDSSLDGTVDEGNEVDESPNTNETGPDHDGDGIEDEMDNDDDGDGVLDTDEVDGCDLLADCDGDGVNDREDAKTGTSTLGIFGDDDYVVFSNYIYQNNVGQIYGLGGGFYRGQYRLNYDQNRIELGVNTDIKEVVIEYIADEARSVNPTVHVEAEEALRSYIYYKLVERKSNVPMAEKNRARAEYYNERRKANARLQSFSKEEALKTIRKNFKQAPKY